MFNIRIPDLPPYARLFVALFTALMVLVCIWAAFVYYVEKSTIDEPTIQAYLGELVGEDDDRLKETAELAHTHISSMTLLFFAAGFVFLFTTTRPKIKRATLVAFANAIILHAIGLTGKGYHWFFDDMLSVTGVVILVVTLYMAFVIFVDLAKKSTREASDNEG